MIRPLLSLLLIAAATTLCAQTPALVHDIWAGPGHANPTLLTPYNNQLYFGARDSLNGNELHRYSGSGAPVLVHDLVPGTGSGMWLTYNRHMGVLNGKLYYPGYGYALGQELFVYDGVNPPSLVADIEPGSGYSLPSYFFTLGDRMYFNATTDSTGYELYIYDGVNPPVLTDINPGAADSDPQGFILFQNRIFFRAATAAGGEALYAYDTAAKTYSAIPAGGLSCTSNPILANGKLYFHGVAPGYGNELLCYDGNTVSRVTDLAAGALNGTRANGPLVYLNNAIYFTGSTDGVNYRLCRLDVPSGTASQLSFSIPSPSDPAYLTVYNGSVYFSGFTSATGKELWQLNGNNQQLVLFDIAPGSASSNAADFQVWNGSLYMNARTDSSGYELYRIDDTTVAAGVRHLFFAGSATVRPNPAKDQATLVLLLDKGQRLAICLYDVAGRLVWQEPARDYPAGTQELSLPLEGLPAGTYYYQVADGAGRRMATGRLVRE